jgi:hypothetical protein
MKADRVGWPFRVWSNTIRSAATWADDPHSLEHRATIFRSLRDREDKIAQIREFFEQSFTHTVLFKESDWD